MKIHTTLPFTLTSDQRAAASRYLARRKADLAKAYPGNRMYITGLRLRIEALEQGLAAVDAHASGKEVIFTTDDYHYVMTAAELG
jgi:hypothetical protein